MQINLNDIEFLVGDYEILSNMPTVPALPTFSKEAVDFLAALSSEILRIKEADLMLM